MKGKWLIADRDLNEREGLKWLLKTSSIPVTSILLAPSYEEFVVLFERESPDVVLLELDMISRGEWTSFRSLIKIYDPILLLTSAEATFEKARLAIDMQALDLLIKPFSPTKVKLAFQAASRKWLSSMTNNEKSYQNILSHTPYEALFLPQDTENFSLAAFQTESKDTVRTLYSFLEEYSFVDLEAVFPLSELVVLIFKSSCPNVTEQCQKAMSRWEEEFSEPVATVINKGTSRLNEKYLETLSMLRFTYYRGYGQVVEFKRPEEWIQIDPFLDPPEQKLWIDMLAKCDLEKIKHWLYSEFLGQQEPYPDPDLVRIRLTSILAQIRRFMKSCLPVEHQGFEMDYGNIFNSILYDAVLYRTVQNLILFMQKLFTEAKKSKKNLTQDPINRGLVFIEVNFSKIGLKLEDVAEHVDRNPAYFSHLLMSQTGKGFAELLTEIRMNEAKRLLVNTNKTIKEISNLAGYNNANYFSRIFKETQGITPREFRTNSIR